MIEREFDYQSQKNNSSGTLILRVYMPEPTKDDDWEYALELPENSIEGKLIGVDSLQALPLAIKTAKTLLINYTTANQATITWLGMDNIGLNL